MRKLLHQPPCQHVYLDYCSHVIELLCVEPQTAFHLVIATPFLAYPLVSYPPTIQLLGIHTFRPHSVLIR